MWYEGNISNCEDEIDRTYSKLKNIFMKTTHMWDDFIKTPDYSESLNQKDDEELLSRLLQIINLYGSMDVESSIPKDDEEHGSVDVSSSIPKDDEEHGSVDVESSIPKDDEEHDTGEIAPEEIII